MSLRLAAAPRSRTGPAGLAAVGGLLALAGCGEVADIVPPGWSTGAAWDVDGAAALPVPADPFAAALQAGYVGLARAELADFDWASGALYVARARAVAGGQLPEPREPPEPGMADAREPLIAFLRTPGAMLRAGPELGRAQVSWDCWAGEVAEEKGRQDLLRLDGCRERFMALVDTISELAELPGDMVVVLPEEGEVGGIVVERAGGAVTLDRAWAAADTGGGRGTLPVAEGEIRDAFGGALDARPKPPVTYEVLFDFGSTRIGDADYTQVMEIADEVRSRAAAEVLVTGHADAPGDSAANLRVSRTRAGTVRTAVLNELRRGEAPVFTVEARGERDPAINTPRVERRNRRVVVTVR